MAEEDERSASPQPTADERSAQLAYEQAIKYGEDLRRVYLTEKARRQELELANQLLAAVFASTPDGLVVLDETLTVRQANPVFCRLIEARPEAIIGQPLASVFPAQELHAALAALREGQDEQAQVELTLEQPVQRSLFIRIARLEAGQQRGWVLSLHDQTERKRLEYQKAEFINIAAHELRTPLTFIMGLAELLAEQLEDNPDRELTECVQGIIRGSQRLSAVVDQLLAFTQATEGTLQPFTAREVNLSALLQEIAQQVEERRAAQQVILHIEVLPPQITMHINPILLRTTLYQLILNGITFNKPGGRVDVHAQAQGDEVLIRIADTGVGIPQADLDQIFQPFYQVEEHTRRRTGGLGLGLSIVQNAVAGLGGTIAVESTLGEGSTFSLRLPLRQSGDL